MTSQSAQQTMALGKKIARSLQGGDVIALIGDLGSGKTTLIKGLAQGLGVKETITSPSYVLMKTYKPTKKKINHLIHVDAYRLQSAQDLIDVGLNDWLSQPGSVTIIEWADQVKEILPKNTIVIKLKLGQENNQRIIKSNVKF